MKTQTIEDRFWPKVDKSGACWEWTAAKGGNGYGMLWMRDGARAYPLMAHRVAYELTVGAIPAGMVIDHLCHNRACVNPDHLRVASQKQNSENLTNSRRNGRSGIRGVSMVTKTGRWRACVKHNYKFIHVGVFATKAEAESAVIAKRLELFTHNDADRRAS